MIDFGTRFSEWMDKASSFWNAIPAQWHTILIISLVVLVGFIILDVVKSIVSTGVRVLLVVVAVAVVCVNFPWVGAAAMAVIQQGWAWVTSLI